MQDNCSRCKTRKAVMQRRYSGEKLCPGCFISTFERRVYKTITRYKMFRERDRIAVGVSGGKDSLALLRVLSKIEQRFPFASLVAITIDEGIPGYREEAVEISRSYCKELGVEHHVFTFEELYGFTVHEVFSQDLVNEDVKPCSLCGVMRRKALNVAAREVGATVIATAHTLDDVVQTYFMNFLRGEKVKAMIGVRREDGNNVIPRVAPFRLTPQNEVVLYAYLCKIPFQATICPNAPTSQRDPIREFLSTFEERYPGSLYAALSSIEALISGERSKELGNVCVECGEPSSRNLCRACELLESVKKLLPQLPPFMEL